MTASIPQDAIPQGALLNRVRATEIMAQAGIDALILSRPLNVYYATSLLPMTSRLFTTDYTTAVVPRDPAAPIAVIAGAPEYCLGSCTLPPQDDVHPYLFAMPPGSMQPRVLDVAALSDREKRQQELMRKLQSGFSTSAVAALSKALNALGLSCGRVGIDNMEALALTEQAMPSLLTRPAEDLVRRIRLIKTPREIALMRRASANNVPACLAAARAAREEGSIRGVRERYFAEAGRRGNVPVFALIDFVVDETFDAPLREGQMLMLDCVSHYAFYQSDFARTVCIGEPTKEHARILRAMSTAWDEVRERLRPGLKFSEIMEIGNSTLKKHGYDYAIPFKPHSVGLSHDDQPQMAIDGGREDIALEEGFILSVDCPVADVGFGGTAHLEDLMEITSSGARPVHALGENAIIV